MLFFDLLKNLFKLFCFKYKEHLDSRKQCLEMKPMKLNTTKDLDGLGFRRVVCKGIFDEQRSIYVGPKPRSMSKSSEIGFYVITPLLPIPNEPNRSGIYSLYAQTKLKSF